MVAIADESGGACYGNHINRDFKERKYVEHYVFCIWYDLL